MKIKKNSSRRNFLKTSALDALCRYCYEQGLIKEKVKLEDLFDRSSLSLNEK